jgi:iron complex transport system substrate-binding protein
VSDILRRATVVWSVVVLSVIAVAGCRRPADDRADASPNATFTVGAWVTRSAGATTARDASGATLDVKRYERIVSLAPNTTEILFALGVSDRVVGVTTNCNYPLEASTKETIGDYNLNYEKIVSLKPDLAVGSSGFTDTARGPLEKAGIAYYAVSHATFAELLESVYALGTLLGVEDAANGIVAAFNAAARRAAERVPKGEKVPVFWIQWNLPLSTVGPGNFHHDLIEYAGGRNVASDIGVPYGQFSEELFVERAPEVILVPSKDVGDWTRKRFPSVPAVKNGRVYVYSSDESARPGPRLTVALDALSHLLYPTP